MEELEYDDFTEQLKKINEKIEELENTDRLQEYLQLQKQASALQKNIYKSCKHILVYSKIEYACPEGRIYRWCGCIKCGLDNRVLDLEQYCLSSEQEAMLDYLQKYSFSGIHTGYACELTLAQSIYSKIKQAYPNIDDATAIKYFKNALDNIRNNKVNEGRQFSRVKRLSLNSNFKHLKVRYSST